VKDKNEVALDLIRQEAKDAYFTDSYTSIAQLSKSLGVKETTLRRWVYHGSHGEEPWSKMKAVAIDTARKDAAIRAADKMVKLYETNVELGTELANKMMAGMENLEHNPELQIKMLNALTNHYKAIHQVIRLDDGKSTKNVEIQNTGQSESLEQIIELDPFSDMEQIDGD
jgi:hypothetical protein